LQRLIPLVRECDFADLLALFEQDLAEVKAVVLLTMAEAGGELRAQLAGKRSARPTLRLAPAGR
jgi:hypothetical protein